MSHRDPTAKDFVGKTIKRVDVRAINLWRLFFTDGTAIAIEHERDGMVVCDVCVKPPKKPKKQPWPPTCCCGGFVQEGAFVHTETCPR